MTHTEVGMGTWAPKQLHGDTTCAVRVHSDGYVMWHRVGCDFGGKEHGLSLGEVGGLPYETFLAALDREGTEDGRTVLFCGACLVYEPKGASQ